jgi:hypothetical protein
VAPATGDQVTGQGLSQAAAQLEQPITLVGGGGHIIMPLLELDTAELLAEDELATDELFAEDEAVEEADELALVVAPPALVVAPPVLLVAPPVPVVGGAPPAEEPPKSWAPSSPSSRVLPSAQPASHPTTPITITPP